MALIKCSECGNDVSDRAAACPRCGNPIAVAVPATSIPTKRVWDESGAIMAADRVIPIEQTGKEYKAEMLIGAVVAGIGFAMLFTGNAIIGAIAVLGGLTLYGAARIGAWWNHG